MTEDQRLPGNKISRHCRPAVPAVPPFPFLIVQLFGFSFFLLWMFLQPNKFEGK